MKSGIRKEKASWLLSALLVCLPGALFIPLTLSPQKALAASVPRTLQAEKSCVVVTYQITSQWAGGFVATLTITNHCSVSIPVCWNLEFTFPANQQITQGWNATFSQAGNHVIITGCVIIPPGGSFSIGFAGTWIGSNPVPTEFLFNGVPT